MTCCTMCVTVLAFLLQVLSHFLPNTQLKHEYGWWQFGSKEENKGSTVAAWIHTIAVLFDFASLTFWCISIVEPNPSSPPAEAGKCCSKTSGVISAFLKGCGCGWHFCYPKPGMVWCCLFSGTSLLFNLIALCTSDTDEHEQRY